MNGKQPWEMTKAEYAVSLRGKKIERGPKGLQYYNRAGQIAANHRLAVEHAVQEGKPVPPEVLADYGDH